MRGHTLVMLRERIDLSTSDQTAGRRLAITALERLPGLPLRRRVFEDALDAPSSEGNRVRILRNGREIFPAMLEAVDSANFNHRSTLEDDEHGLLILHPGLTAELNRHFERALGVGAVPSSHPAAVVEETPTRSFRRQM